MNLGNPTQSALSKRPAAAADKVAGESRRCHFVAFQRKFRRTGGPDFGNLSAASKASTALPKFLVRSRKRRAHFLRLTTESPILLTPTTRYSPNPPVRYSWSKKGAKRKSIWWLMYSIWFSATGTDRPQKKMRRDLNARLRRRTRP